MAQLMPGAPASGDGRRLGAWRPLRTAAGVALAASVVAGCGGGGHASPPTIPLTAPKTTAPATSTSGPQTSGPRTVLSPNGLNVRGAPSASAPVLGTAAQGAVLTVLGYTNSDNGWFKVKGATVTGWITAQPTLSAPGEFRSYSSPAFSALYPADWTEAPLAGSAGPTTSTPTTVPSTSTPPASGSTGGAPAPAVSVSFRPRSGAGDIVIRSAGSVAGLPQGRAGYGRTSVSQVVVCGVTAGLVVFKQSGGSSSTAPATSVPESLSYLAEIRFAVDNQLALGLYADMSDLGTAFQIFKEVAASVTFSSPQCSG